MLVWAVSAVAMAIVWAISMRVRNIGYVDVAWAGLMALAALLVGALGEGAELPRGLVALIGGVWGTRLCLHLLTRVLHEPEDGQVSVAAGTLERKSGKFFVFFQMQALVVVFVRAALRRGRRAPSQRFRCAWTLAAIVVWLVAVGGETLADRQLAAFRQDPGNRGKTCRHGPLVVVAASELFFRVAALVHLRLPRRGQPPVPGSAWPGRW